jgi:RNA polymerase primary sigma factor
MLETATARPLPVLVEIQGRQFLWTPGVGLDPAAALTVDAFVWRVARRLAKAGAHHGHRLEDLVQAGRLGALEAARRFDPTLENTFLTYAAWWIRHAVFALVDQGELHIPKRVWARLVAQESYLPVASLAAPLPSGEGELADRILSESPSQDDVVEAEAIIQAVRAAMQALPEVSRRTLERRYFEGATLEAIAEDEGVSREAIRQRQGVAERRLRRIFAERGIQESGVRP